MRLRVTAAVLCAAVSAAAQVSRAGEDATNELAEAIVSDAGVKKGISLDLTRGDAALAVALAKASALSVYRVTSDAAGVIRDRRFVEAAGLAPLRVRVECGPLGRLAYPDYCANLMVIDSLEGDEATREVARLLRPGGTAYVRQPAGQVAGVLRTAAVEGFKVEPGPARLTRLRRLPLDGAGNWTHYQYDPSNNRYSPDTHIRPPFRVLWYSDPIRTRGGLWVTQGLAADGRLFLTDLSPANPDRAYITAKDAYNGTVLWEREVGGPRFFWPRPLKKDDPNFNAMITPPGKVVPGQMAIAGGKIFVADSARCLIIDAASGKDLASLKAPSPTHPKNHWVYLACAGGRLYGYTADPYRMPPKDKVFRYYIRTISSSKEGGPPTLFALDLKEPDKALWTRVGGAEGELGEAFSAPLAIGEDRIFVRSGKDLHALDAATGKTAWVVRGVEKAGEESWREGTVHGGRFYLFGYDRRFYVRRAHRPVLAFATSDGSPVGEEKVGRNPLAFFDSAAKVCRMGSGGNGCPLGTGAGKVVFSRNGYFMEGGGRRVYGGFRAACLVGALPANGLVHLLPTWGCHCLPFSATITLQPGQANERIKTAPPPAVEAVADLPAGAGNPAMAADWPTFRANPARTAVTAQDLSSPMAEAWKVKVPGVPTPPIAVADMVCLGSSDECVYAMESATGRVRWTFHTSGAVRAAPVYWDGRVYVGSEDGWVYCLAAVDGRLLWRFRAAPFSRKQVAFGRIASAWPVRQGLAVAGGTVYFTCGRVPDQGVMTYALDATSGRMVWRSDLGRGVVPCGALVVTEDRVFVSAEGNAPGIQLSRADGARKGTGSGHFAEMGFVEGLPDDGEVHSKGFLVHGGGGVGRGYGETFRAYGYPYNLHPAPWTEPPEVRGRVPQNTAFGDVFSFLPVFGTSRAYFRHGGELVAVERSKLQELRATRDARRRSPRDKFVLWRGEKLPCGTPEWAILAGPDDSAPEATVVTGGPKGVAAVEASSGVVRWSVNWEGSTLPPAVARGRVFITSTDGTIRCLAGAKRALRDP